jgi:RNA polymerase sigma-70 factor (family 1)
MDSQIRLGNDEMRWAEEIQAGNARAFSLLFDTYYIPLCQYAYRFSNGNTEATEDIVQEVFTRIWERRTTWIPKITVKAYLYRSVHNQAISNLRKAKHETPMNDMVEQTTPGTHLTPIEEMHNDQLDQRIQQAIGNLPERRREILTLRMIHELSYKEIGEMLGISVNTVDTQLRRALKSLREDLHLFQNGLELV